MAKSFQTLGPLRVLIRTESDGEKVWWVAQCLEYDISAQAVSLEALEHELARSLAGRIVTAHKLGIEPFENLPPAPESMWAEWEAAKKVESSAPRPFKPHDDGPAMWMHPPAWEARVA